MKMNRLLVDVDKVAPIDEITDAKIFHDCFSFQTSAGSAVVTSNGCGVFRFSINNSANRNEYGIIEKYERASLEVVINEEGYDVKAGGYTLRLEKSPLRVSLLMGSSVLLSPSSDSYFTKRFKFPPIAATSNGFTFSFDLPLGEKVYGLGEKHEALNHRGALILNRNEDSLGVNHEETYKNTPFAWSPKGWGIYLHTTADTKHAIGYAPLSHISYILETEDEVFDLFLFGAATPASMLYKYTELTGRPPILPLWSYGAWISKAYYATPDDAYEAAKTFRDKKLPADVISYDGRAWQDTDTRFIFEWDKKRFDDPEKSTKDLKDLNFHVNCWLYPNLSVDHERFSELADKDFLLKNSDGSPSKFEWDMAPFGEVLTPLPESGIYDFTNPEMVKWWKEEIHKMVDMGVSCLKPDFGEQVEADMIALNGDSGRYYHNALGLIYNRACFEALEEKMGAGNAVLWGRSGWTGSQKYGAQWSADSQTSFGGLGGAIMGNLSWGLCGAAYYSYDIGGFYGEQPNLEIFVRYMQAGILASHTRFHGIGDREPWIFGDEGIRIAREWLGYRYSLIPYIMNAGKQANAYGIPIVRAMPLAYPNNKELWSYEYQYMLGDDIFCAPIIAEGGRANYMLPEGTFYNFFTGESVRGGVVVDSVYELDRAPVFVADGAVIKFAPKVQHTGEFASTGTLDFVGIYGVPNKNYEDEDIKVTVFDAHAEIAFKTGKVSYKVYGKADVLVKGDVLFVR